MYRTILALLGLSLINTCFADDFKYCARKGGYVRVGMTAAQVVAACGEPQSKLIKNTPVMQKVPMQQLFYNNLGTDTGFYGVWNMPVSTSNVGNGGSKMQVNIVDNKVLSISLDGNNTNALSMCQGQSIQVGDSGDDVRAACGTPRRVNETFIEVPIPSKTKPEIWVYTDAYQPTLSLTFVDGKLQSLE